MSTVISAIQLPRIQALIGVVLISMLVGCAPIANFSDQSKWSELTFVVDVVAEVVVGLPPAERDLMLDDVQFVATKDNPISNIFFGLYDPGWWKDRDLLLTRISGTVVRVDGDSNRKSELTTEDIEREVYMPRKGATQRFDFKEIVELSGRKWLRLDYLGYPHGMAYATVIGENLVLTISMTMFGEDARQTKLFSERQKTLKDVVSSTRITKVEP